MKAYLAARYSRRAELCHYRDWLTVAGWEVTSRWLDGQHQADFPDGDSTDPAHTEERAGWASDDLVDIDRAQVVVVFTEPADTDARRGGRHVELGYALAKRKTILTVGPLENIFVCLPAIDQHPDWFSASSRLAALLADHQLPRAVAG